MNKNVAWVLVLTVLSLAVLGILSFTVDSYRQPVADVVFAYMNWTVETFPGLEANLWLQGLLVFAPILLAGLLVGAVLSVLASIIVGIFFLEFEADDDENALIHPDE